jgi:hypothetical protein
MSAKTVFISSTFKDLKDYRREVWDALRRFSVSVRGMEEFGARTARPLETCLAEVEQSDVYVGIIAYRLGSIDPETKKPFTVLEYEKAFEQNKDILIYVADENAASFPPAQMDQEAGKRRQLAAFKSRLRDSHTVDTFSTPADLVEKLSRDFKKHFESRQESPAANDDDSFAKTTKALDAFRLTPKRYNGREVRLFVRFWGGIFPASRQLCQQFNLEYGFTIGSYIRIVKPDNKDSTGGFSEIYATGNKVDELKTMAETKQGDLYAQLQFTEEDVKRIHAEFLGRSYYDQGDDPGDPNEVWIPPEGKVILLFTKPA